LIIVVVLSALGPAATMTSPTDVCADSTCTAKLGGVAAADVSGRHGCALINGGAVRCWGKNDRGQLGDGTTTDSNFVVDALAGGASGSDVRCWGLNQNGQLGLMIPSLPRTRPRRQSSGNISPTG
jgi:alpha-tubulin suppressor-like RCC1 family protein